MNAITCDDLVFRRGDKTVLNRIGFELAPGRLLGLIGHNGAGKSTLIKLILGLLKPASGRQVGIAYPADKRWNGVVL